ncbi:hypothetical protein H6769_03790 [Candidatus Peribacteria bacterium]|nr:hypothetical protein [Candidatus Peribacteria bacterium]
MKNIPMIRISSILWNCQGYMQQLGYNDEIQTVEDLVSVFQENGNQKENQEVDLPKNLDSYKVNLIKFLQNIELQVRSIQELFHSTKSENITSITLYRETNPMRVFDDGKL